MSINLTELYVEKDKDSLKWCSPEYASSFFAARREGLQDLNMNFSLIHAYGVSEILRALGKSTILTHLMLSNSTKDGIFWENDQPDKAANQAGALIWSALAHLEGLRNVLIYNAPPVCSRLFCFSCLSKSQILVQRLLFAPLIMTCHSLTDFYADKELPSDMLLGDTNH